MNGWVSEFLPPHLIFPPKNSQKDFQCLVVQRLTRGGYHSYDPTIGNLHDPILRYALPTFIVDIPFDPINRSIDRLILIGDMYLFKMKKPQKTEDSYSVSREVDGQTYHLSIIDTAGQEEYRGLWAPSNLRSDAFLLVYDITQADSLASLDPFLQLIEMESDHRVDIGTVEPVKIVVGNKCDLAKFRRQVRSAQGLDYARRHGCGFMETSARDMVNVEETFARKFFFFSPFLRWEVRSIFSSMQDNIFFHFLCFPGGFLFPKRIQQMDILLTDMLLVSIYISVLVRRVVQRRRLKYGPAASTTGLTTTTISGSASASVEKYDDGQIGFDRHGNAIVHAGARAAKRRRGKENVAFWSWMKCW